MNLKSNAKAFIHERIIYEYMMFRFSKNNLTMRHVIRHGKLLHNPSVVSVSYLEIIDTTFPDVERIVLKGDKNKEGRPGEIKFLTSEFKYHRDDIDRFHNFMEKLGCIIVLRNDNLPLGLIEKYPDIDVYELDKLDFEQYVKENFDRLFHKQLLSRDGKPFNIWIMSQAPNFYKGYKKMNIQPASESGLWCPKDTSLTKYDIATGDKILFLKFGKEFRLSQLVQDYWKSHKSIYPDWFITELYIGEVTTPLMDRSDFCNIKGIPIHTPLWKNESDGNKQWSKIFEFRKINNWKCNINLREMYSELPDIVHPILYYVFTQQVSVNVKEVDYIKILEYVLDQYKNGECVG
ncbi:hypothetical protein J7E34_03085 [Chryseobacterium sp. ISL-80]|nr:hypothetical protein [Chryseobacterium sp. ISL-80]